MHSYQAAAASLSAYSAVRSLRYHWHYWAEATEQAPQPPLFLLHGWMDVGASWQFVVDALRQQGYNAAIIAPDWRGFGRTPSKEQDSFYFPDYLADLDAFIPAALQQLGLPPDQPVDIAGHSMGAHAALLYAAARPRRLRRLINLEGFGAPPAPASAAPGRYAQWLDELQALRAGQFALKPYASAAAVAQRLMKTNPRIAPAHAAWLAQHWAQADAQGQWHILGEAAHKVTNPVLFRVEEVQACYAAITCRVQTILARENRLHEWQGGNYSLADYLERLAHIAQNETVFIEEAGHMLHHDQPLAVAAAMLAFLQN